MLSAGAVGPISPTISPSPTSMLSAVISQAAESAVDLDGTQRAPSLASFRAALARQQADARERFPAKFGVAHQPRCR